MIKALSKEEIITALEEAKSLLLEFTQVIVYFKYNKDGEVIDILTDSQRNEYAEEHDYHLEYVFKA